MSVVSSPARRPAEGPPVRVYVAATGNVFMQEIAEWLVGALGELGRDAELRTEGVPLASADHVNLVVAPHEYFELTLTTERDRRRAALASVPVCTEQPGTPWFELQLARMAGCPLVLDINAVGADAQRSRGVEAVHLPLGYQAGFDAWGGDPARNRPIDVLFMGSLTPRREAALARMAHLLSGLECRFLLFEATRPARAGDPGFVSGRDKAELLASAKVVLNVHRGEVAYFESVRALEAVANGAVVVTEPALDLVPFRPVEHIVTAPLDSLAATCVALIGGSQWREEVRDSAYRHLRERHRLADTLSPLLSRIDAAASEAERRTLATVKAPGGLGPPAPPSAGALPVPAPVPPVAPEPPSTQAMFKRVLLDQLLLRRRLDEIECLIRHGSTRHDEITTSAAYDEIEPDVSVVIPCYGYGRFVAGAVDSVASSWGVVPEIIVVDDHSADGTSEVVRRYMATHPWVPLKLVTRHANAGLAPARNLGFELARAPYVFPLDADNEVYPQALLKLRRALHGSEHAAAYGILEMFNERQALLSAIPWSVERLVLGPYIDAAALIRREAWVAVGGYSADTGALYGWEDYDLWLNVASHGWSVAHVPEILVRYRSHGGSMIHTTNLETASIGAHLRRRHPELPWPRPPGT